MLKISKFELTSYDLKIIAMLTMLIDHIASIFFPNLFYFKIIGRAAFVLFSFLLVEGFVHTKSPVTYLGKLLLFAFLSEIPYDLAFTGTWMGIGRANVLFTLSAGVVAMMILNSKLARDLKFFYIYLIVVLSTFLKFDYFYLGVLQIVFFYTYRSSVFKKFVSVTVLNLFYSFRITIQSFAFLGLIPIYFYNGRLGRKSGLLFYTFYGLHLLVFGLIKKYFL